MSEAPATTMFRGDAARTGNYPVSWAVTLSHRIWRYSAGAWIKSSPVIVGDTVYVCALDGTVHAVDARNGAPRWTWPTGDGIDSSPAVAAGSVYVSSAGGVGCVHAFDAASGRQLWSVRTGGQAASSPAVTDGLVIIGGPRSTMFALDARTGEQRWTCPIEAYLAGVPRSGPMWSSPAVADGAVYVTGGGRLYALEAATGQLKWTADVGCMPMVSPAVHGGKVYVTEMEGRLCAVGAGDGHIRWRTRVDSMWFLLGAVVISGGTVLAGGSSFELDRAGGALVALDAATGAVRWQYLTESKIEASPAAADGIVYLATHGNSRHSARLTALEIESGSLRWWRWLPTDVYGGVVSSPAIAGGCVYIGLPNGQLLAMPAHEPESFSLLERVGAWLRRSEREKLAGLLQGGATARPVRSATLALRARPAGPENLGSRLTSDRRDERRVMDLFAQARRERAAGQIGEATQTMTELLDIARELAKRHPEDFVHQQAIASALYMLGAVHMDARRPDAAVAALDECEEIYRRLGRANFLDARPLVADVKMRRAGAQAAKGLGASAVVEADAAVATYLELTGGALHDKRSRDLARVLARNSLILARFGDPDLAVGSAGFAVRIYLAQRVDASQFAIHDEDVGYLRQAAAQAALIHLQHGRLEDGLFVAEIAVQYRVPAIVADVVRRTASSLAITKQVDVEAVRTVAVIMYRLLDPQLVGEDGGTPPDDPLLSTTLAGALDSVGQDRDEKLSHLLSTSLAGALGAVSRNWDEKLSQALTRPVLDSAIVIPSQRCDPQKAALYASQLAEGALEVLPTMPVEGIRMGLEAHYLFAAASGSGPSLAPPFQNLGPGWAAVLLACSAAFEARNDPMMALDTASWASRVARVN